MGQDLIDDDFSESGVIEDVSLRNANNEKVKSNKCNQCNYASSQKRQFQNTFENAQWRKTKQMQPM